MTNVSAFFSEFLGTAILLMALLAFTDRKNHPLPNGLLPLALFILFVGLGSSLGMETGTTCPFVPLSYPLSNLTAIATGYAFNPARDFGPRLLTSMVGYGKDVYTYRKYVSHVVIVWVRKADVTDLKSILALVSYYCANFGGSIWRDVLRRFFV